MRVRRAALLVLLALAALNLFTGAPLLALWAGALVQGERGGLEMASVGAVIGAMAALCAALVWALGRLGAAYDRVTGRPPRRARQTSWLRPFNTPPRAARAELPVGALDVVLVAAVVIALVVFELWFFLYAGSPFG